MLSASILKSIFEFQTWIPNVYRACTNIAFEIISFMGMAEYGSIAPILSSINNILRFDYNCHMSNLHLIFIFLTLIWGCRCYMILKYSKKTFDVFKFAEKSWYTSFHVYLLWLQTFSFNWSCFKRQTAGTILFSNNILFNTQ